MFNLQRGSADEGHDGKHSLGCHADLTCDGNNVRTFRRVVEDDMGKGCGRMSCGVLRNSKRYSIP